MTKRDELKARLLNLLNKPPPGLGDFGLKASRDFKEDQAQARKLIKNPAASIHSLQAAINYIDGRYFGGRG